MNKNDKTATGHSVDSNTLLEILKDYSLQYQNADNGEPCLLVDALSPEEDDTIYRGKMELELLAEHIACSLSNS